MFLGHTFFSTTTVRRRWQYMPILMVFHPPQSGLATLLCRAVQLKSCFSQQQECNFIGPLKNSCEVMIVCAVCGLLVLYYHVFVCC